VFEPGSRAWEAQILPVWTTAAFFRKAKKLAAFSFRKKHAASFHANHFLPSGKKGPLFRFSEKVDWQSNGIPFDSTAAQVLVLLAIH